MIRHFLYRTVEKISSTTTVLCLIALFIFPPLYAQKRKKEDEKAPIKKTASPAEKKAKAEHYFIEGEKFYMLNDFPRAYESFKKVISIEPKNATANYKIAQILSGNKENTKALKHAQIAKNNGKKNKFYYLLLANIYTNIAQLDNAILTYQEMLENVPGSEQHLFDLAELQMYQNKYDDALISYEKAKDRFGVQEEIVYRRQQIYLKQNKLDLAISEGRLLIESNPSEPTYSISLAQVLLANNRGDEGRKVLEDYNAKYGANDRINFLLAEINKNSGNTDKALALLQPVFQNSSTSAESKVRTLLSYMSLLPNKELEGGIINLVETLITTHPDSYQGYAVAGDLYFNLGEKLKAKKNYLKAIEIDQSNYNIWQNILSLEMELQQYDDVIKHAAEALEIFPNQAALYYFGGSAYLIQKKYNEAIKVLNVGKFYTNSDPNLRSIFFGQLGDAYNGIGNHDKSDRSYDEALKTKSDNDHVLNNYSYFLSLRKEKLDKALDMSSKLVKKHPDNSTYLDTHAWVLYMMQDFRTAKKFLERAIEDQPSSAIFEHYGDVLFQLGEVEQAVIQWEKAKDGSSDVESLDKKISNRQLYE